MRNKDQRQYSDEEVRSIINKAVMAQEADRRKAAGYAEGLTLEEIQRILHDAGVDPNYVTAAAASLGQQPTSTRNPILGGPRKVAFQRIIPGELTPETIDDMVQCIRKRIGGERGHFELFGRAYEWNTDNNESDQIFIRAEWEDGQTVLDIRQDFMGWAILTHIWEVLLLAFGVVNLVTGSEAGIPMMVASVVLYFVARFAFDSISRSRTARLEALGDELESLARQATPQRTSTAPLAEQPSASLLSLNELEEPDAHEQALRRTRSRGAV